MLFKALLRRLNGGTDTSSTKVSSTHRRTSNLAYDKYPNLSSLIFRLLHGGSEHLNLSETSNIGAQSVMKAQSVFAALEVIERSGLPPAYQAEALDVLWRYSESPDWSVREKAAKTLAIVLDSRSFEDEATELLSLDYSSHNALHGRLLCLRFLLDQQRAPLFDEALRM